MMKPQGVTGRFVPVIDEENVATSELVGLQSRRDKGQLAMILEQVEAEKEAKAAHAVSCLTSSISCLHGLLCSLLHLETGCLSCAGLDEAIWWDCRSTC